MKREEEKCQAKYMKTLHKRIGDLRWAVKGLQNPQSRVPSLDKFWKLKTYLRLIRETHKGLLREQPPFALYEIHMSWLEATRTFNEAAEKMERGIDKRDISLIEAANPLLEQANKKADHAATFLQTYLLAFGFERVVREGEAKLQAVADAMGEHGKMLKQANEDIAKAKTEKERQKVWKINDKRLEKSLKAQEKALKDFNKIEEAHSEARERVKALKGQLLALSGPQGKTDFDKWRRGVERDRQRYFQREMDEFCAGIEKNKRHIDENTVWRVVQYQSEGVGVVRAVAFYSVKGQVVKLERDFGMVRTKHEAEDRKMWEQEADTYLQQVEDTCRHLNIKVGTDNLEG
jgi:hypothetical protein